MADEKNKEKGKESSQGGSPSEAKKKKFNLSKLLGVLFVLANLAIMGGGVYLVYISTLGYTPPKSTNEELDKEMADFQKSLQGKPVLYSMDPFHTNLEGVPRRFIRLQMTLEMLDEEGYEEVINLGPEARDSVMKVLNRKTYQELDTVQGKLRLKNEIVAQLNSFLDRGVVRNVYFSDFAVQ